MITAENFLLIGSVLVFISIIVSKASNRFGIPVLLLFLLIGMLFGSDGLGIQFHSAADAQLIGMMALSVILFSGGMDTKLSEVKPVMAQGVLLSTVGVLLTTILTGIFIFFISGWESTNVQLGLLTSMLLAATMSSTDSASVFNLLRSQNMNLKYNLRPMLELESGSNDPMAYMLTIVLIEIVGSGSDWSLSVVARDLGLQFLFGGAIGYAAGKFGVWLINKVNLPNASLYPILLLSLVFITFTITDLVKGNGYLDQLAHMKSDFENYKRRTNAAKDNSKDEGKIFVIEKILPVLDTFDRARESLEGKPELDAFNMVYRQFDKILSEIGLEEVDVLGEAFDPNLSYAIAKEEAGEDNVGKVVAVLSKGYKFKDKIVRYSQVKVGC